MLKSNYSVFSDKILLESYWKNRPPNRETRGTLWWLWQWLPTSIWGHHHMVSFTTWCTSLPILFRWVSCFLLQVTPQQGRINDITGTRDFALQCGDITNLRIYCVQSWHLVVVVLTFEAGVSHHTPPPPGGTGLYRFFFYSEYFYKN